MTPEDWFLAPSLGLAACLAILAGSSPHSGLPTPG